MALVPNGTIRPQVRQGAMQHSVFTSAQAQAQAQRGDQSNPTQRPQPEPRLTIEQDAVVPPAAEASEPQSSPVPQSSAPAPEGAEVGSPQIDPSAIADQGQVSEKSIIPFTREMVQNITKVPLRILNQLGGFYQGSTDAQNQDSFTLKFPNWYYGQPERGELSKEDRVKVIEETQRRFNVYFTNAKSDDDSVLFTFSTIDPKGEVESDQDVRLKRVYKSVATDKKASTMGELIANRKSDLFETMRKIAQGRK